MGTVLYLATAEGVLTVTEGEAQSWGIGQRGLKTWNVNEVAVEPSAPNRVYAGTRGDGVWRSDDFGETWTKPNRGRVGPGKVKCVTIDPHDANTVYAGGEPIALWVTLDAGENWEEIASVREFPGVSEVDYPVQAVEPHVRDIVVDAKDRDTMYLNLQVGHIMKTTDGGATWTILDKEVDADAHMLVSRTDDPSRLYLSTGGHSHRLGTAPGRSPLPQRGRRRELEPDGHGVRARILDPDGRQPEERGRRLLRRCLRQSERVAQARQRRRRLAHPLQGRRGDMASLERDPGDCVLLPGGHHHGPPRSPTTCSSQPAPANSSAATTAGTPGRASACRRRRFPT